MYPLRLHLLRDERGERRFFIFLGFAARLLVKTRGNIISNAAASFDKVPEKCCGIIGARGGVYIYTNVLVGYSVR